MPNTDGTRVLNEIRIFQIILSLCTPLTPLQPNTIVLGRTVQRPDEAPQSESGNQHQPLRQLIKQVYPAVKRPPCQMADRSRAQASCECLTCACLRPITPRHPFVALPFSPAVHPNGSSKESWTPRYSYCAIYCASHRVLSKTIRLRDLPP